MIDVLRSRAFNSAFDRKRDARSISLSVVSDRYLGFLSLFVNEFMAARRVAVLLQEERHDLDVLLMREGARFARRHQLGDKIEHFVDVKIIARIGEFWSLQRGSWVAAGLPIQQRPVTHRAVLVVG